MPDARYGSDSHTLRQIHRQLVNLTSSFEHLETALLNLAQQGLNKMSEMDDKLATLQADVASESTAVDSAVTLIQGISQQIADAVAAAQAAGATPQQLQALTDLDDAVKAKTQSLADAVTQNTSGTTSGSGGGTSGGGTPTA